MEIIELNESYNSTRLHFEYQTSGHFQATVSETDETMTLHFEYVAFEQVKTMAFDDTLVSDYMENYKSYGAKVDGQIVGYLVITFDDWNKRVRINQLLIEPEFRNRGIGTSLMNHAEEVAKYIGARAIILETQSCNLPAITFYRSCGYQIVGCDVMCYSNEDIEKAEVRLEMGKKLG